METIEKIYTLYLEWCNNFLSINKFADYYNLTEIEANNIIEIGRQLSHIIFDNKFTNLPKPI